MRSREALRKPDASPKNLATVAVIGAGPLGLRLAHLCAAAGFRTILEDVLPSNLRKAESLFSHAPEDETGVGLPIEYATTIEDAVRTADLIVDCVPDELESKLEIFSLLDRMAPPHSILGTPTLALSIADLASCTYRPERCVSFELPRELTGAGPLRKASPVVVVRTQETLPEVLEAVQRFWHALGLQVIIQDDPQGAAKS